MGCLTRFDYPVAAADPATVPLQGFGVSESGTRGQGSVALWMGSARTPSQYLQMNVCIHLYVIETYNSVELLFIEGFPGLF